MKAILGDFSVREKNLWFELIVDVVVALYYYPKVFKLMLAGSLTGTAMTNLIVSTVVLAIIASAVLAALLHQQQKPEPLDERDFYIDARATLWFARVLVFGVVSVMGWIVLQEFNPWPDRALFVMSPLVIAHFLLFSLMLASMTKSILKLLMYRLGS
jgi:hypothetical protein